MAEKRPTPVKPLTIYFYHTRLTRESYEEWKDYKFPGHILYGLPLLEKYGIRSVMHKYKAFPGRLRLMLYATKEILCCKEPYEVLYGTSFRGLELIILLRALGFYRKPIVIWHHTALKTSSGKIREHISRFFYKGIDHMFLFSKKLIKDSLATGKAPEEKLQLIHWGPDLAFYDHILQVMPDRKPEGFISTGKENRDVNTMLQAFCATEQQLDLYIAPTNGSVNYQQIIESFCLPDSVQVHYTDGVIPYLLAQKVARKSCVVICCMDFPYTVGLTTLVEAFALGIPVICSRNPNFEMDIDKEEIGSVGATGMHSRFFENTVAEILALTGDYNDLRLRRTLQNSYMLSSDVSAAFDPNYPSVMEKKNCAYFGKGLVLNKYTGARGKSGSNDANPEYIAQLRKIFDEAKVAFQTAELGKVDEGGGGTIAYIPAAYSMNVIDCGVAVLSMHAPWEITSKSDIYEVEKGYEAFLKNCR